MDELNLGDPTPISIPVTIGTKKYMLHEASEDAAVKWQNATTRGAKMDDNKVIHMGDTASAEPILVASCLFELYEHNGEVKERPVLLATVLSWPTRIVRPLFDKVYEISHLRKRKPVKEEEDVIKKSSEATMDISV